MKRDELIEQIRQNMPEFTGTEEEIEAKKALYIYTELGKIKSFDEKYYFGNTGTKKKMYALAKKEERDIEKIAGQKKIICVTLTYLYCNIAKEFGINAFPSVPDETGHVHPIIQSKNGKRRTADIQLDLENIQTKSRLEHFEYEPEEVTKMLIEMGYIKDEKDYKNEEIEKLTQQVKGMNPHQALETILEDEDLYKGNEEMGGIEVHKFYIRALKKIIPNYLNKRIFAFDCYREREDKEKDSTLCVFSEEGSVKTYLYSKKDRKFASIGIDQMKKLQEEGLVLGAKPKEMGANKMKKYIQNKNSQKSLDN